MASNPCKCEAAGEFNHFIIIITHTLNYRAGDERRFAVVSVGGRGRGRAVELCLLSLCLCVAQQEREKREDVVS